MGSGSPDRKPRVLFDDGIQYGSLCNLSFQF
jgi:hypothetical protein